MFEGGNSNTKLNQSLSMVIKQSENTVTSTADHPIQIDGYF